MMWLDEGSCLNLMTIPTQIESSKQGPVAMLRDAPGLGSLSLGNQDTIVCKSSVGLY